MRIVLSEECMSRLDDLHDYITSELQMEDVADDVINRLLDRLSVLESFPLAGNKLES
jgi:hypothetical protein